MGTEPAFDVFSANPFEADPLQVITDALDRIISTRTFHELDVEKRGSENLGAEMLAYERIRQPLFELVKTLNDKRFCTDSHIDGLCALRLPVRRVLEQVADVHRGGECIRAP